MLLHELLVCHLLWFFFLRQLLLLLVDTGELISHCHAIVAIDVTFVTFHTMWVYELRRFLELLLLGKFRLELLLAFDKSLLLDFGCSFLIQILLKRIGCLKLLISLRQLPAVINNIFYFVEILP